MSNSDFVITNLENGVFTIILDHPKANAFTREMLMATQAAFKQAEHDPEVRCILLTAKGKIFSAGQDVREIREVEGESFRYHLLKTYNPLVLQIRRIEKPIIAGINGSVAGASLGVVMACDLRIASEDAHFVVGFSGIGLTMDSAVSLLLPALIGLGRAIEFAFTNAPITAQQALAWGLVNRLAPADELGAQASAWAAELARGPVGAFGLTKRDFNRAVLGNLEEVLDYEAHNQDTAAKGEEHIEGVKAFLDKRSPQYN